MRRRGSYLTHILLLLALAASEALQQQQPQQQQQQQQQRRMRGDDKHLGNDYGPVIHISSAVLQLATDEQTQLLLLPLPEGSIAGGSSSHPTSGRLPWPQIYELDELPPTPRPAAHANEPRLKVSGNLDFQTHYVQSHGR